jgi:trigger factor
MSTATTGEVQVTDVKVERGEDGVATLQIEVAPETVRATREKVVRDFSKRVRVPGFRPGHVPASIVRRNVGDEAIAQNVSDEIVPKAYAAALQQTELIPLDRAEVDQLTFDAFDGEKPLQFTARVVVRPEVDLGEVKGLEATYPTVEVTDEDVEKGLEELRGQRASMKDIEGRGAQEGDIVSAELRVFIDGKEHSEEPSRLRGFILGESGFTPAIDEHLIGATLDEERRFTVSYEEDFKDEELAGKEAEFAVKITSLKERVLPELDEEFAKSVGLEDVAAVRERMHQAILEGRTREAIEAVRLSLVNSVVEGTTFDTPGKLAETRRQTRLTNMEQELSNRGATLEQYLESMERTQEDLDTEIAEDVERELRQELVLDEIATREGLGADNQEIEMHYRQMAYVMGQPLEKIVENLDYETARNSVLQRKAVDWLVENAKIVDEQGNPVENFGQFPGSDDAGEGNDAITEAAENTAALESGESTTSESTGGESAASESAEETAKESA